MTDLKYEFIPINEKNLYFFSVIPMGTVCKNGGCGNVYQSPDSDKSVCCHHPGSPIFHEGMKFWSCCTKRTSDFSAFLNQKGCSEGKHKWIQSVSLVIFIVSLVIRTSSVG